MRDLTKKKLSLACLALLAINIVISLTIFSLDPAGRQLRMTNGTIETYREELIDTAMMELIVWIPLLCLILAFITTFLIKKRQPYLKRYPKGFLVTLTMLYSFYIFLTFIKLIARAF